MHGALNNVSRLVNKLSAIANQPTTFLTSRERRALTAICDTLVPNLVPELNTESASAAVARYNPVQGDLVDRVEAALLSVADADTQRELKLLLIAFETSMFNGVVNGSWDAFSQMPLAKREDILRTWANSRFFTQRKAFQAFKRLVLFIAYSNPLQDDEKHPIWDAIQYSGPPGGGDAPRTIEPLQITESTTLETDVLIIGSGAGGGVVAGELSQAGLDVIVAEKGGYHAEQDFEGNEMKASETLYEKHAALTTADTSLMILAGSTLGGGTTVNWNASFVLPEMVRQEWADGYGFTDALSDDYDRSFDIVWRRMNINSDESQLNANNGKFVKGCQALGLDVEVIPRNVKGCEDCGFCNYGCSFGAKQGTLKTYLQDAHDCGARIVVQANVRRVLHQGGRVTGAIMTVRDADGNKHEVNVKAKAVVVSAGSLHSPAILMRSGLQNPHIGANLHLHPTTPIFSFFDDPIHTWRGVPMSRVVKQYSNLDGKGYGFVLEVAPAHPGLMAATLPWVGAVNHKALVSRMSYLANVITIVRDTHGGQVKLSKSGEPLYHYALHPYDRKHLQRGIIEALKVHQAAGALELYAPHNRVMRYDNRNGGDFVAYLRDVEALGLEPNAFPLFSAHQMSTCRIGGNAQQGAVKPSGETYEVENLFVADASVLPTATGVNPMVTIMATAHYIAQHIKATMN